MINKIDSSYFDWLSWRANDFFYVFGCSVRHSPKIKESIKKVAIGYCAGVNLPCRPKLDHYAVMFWDGQNYWWTHLTEQEFSFIFVE